MDEVVFEVRSQKQRSYVCVLLIFVYIIRKRLRTLERRDRGQNSASLWCHLILFMYFSFLFLSSVS